MIFHNSYSQVDYFARKLALAAIISLTLSLYIFRKNVRSLNAVYLLCFVIVFVVFIVLLNEILHMKWLQPKIPSDQRAVLITGCDRGFGLGFARKLAEAGFEVFAGCLHPVDGEAVALNLHPRIHCVRMDVTKPQEIQMMLDYVVSHLEDGELWAVINNAGISKGSDIQATSMQKIEEVVNVNLMGTIRVTKAFLPLLQKSKGRVVNIASAAGRLLLPGFLPYSISKNAVIAFSDGLRLEMRKFGVHVISVEPWTYRTKLSDVAGIHRIIEKEWNSGSSESRAHVAMLKKTASNLFAWGSSSNLDEVYEVVLEAVMLQYPLYRYRPGKWYLNAAMGFLYLVPQPVVDYALCNFIFKR